MSKSLGNFYTLRDLQEKGFSDLAIRYLLLSNNYRQPLNFTFDVVKASHEALTRMRDFVLRLREAQGESIDPQVADIITRARAAFEDALDDDLNVSKALAAVFDFMRDINKLTPGKQDAQAAEAAMTDFNKVLGVIELEQAESLEEEVERLIQERQAARKAKNFRRADEIRNSLRDRGIILEDTPHGVRWKKAT